MGINNKGNIVGHYYFDNSDRAKGFIFSQRAAADNVNRAIVGIGTPFSISAGPNDYVSGYFVLNAGDQPLASGLLDATTLTVSSVVPSVPEPSTWIMMLLGFAGLGFAFRQSRRNGSFA
jgi:hypothetical protein